MNIIKVICFFIVAIIIISCTDTKKDRESEESELITEPTIQVILSSEINWEPLNPARGDNSPKAGTIWGNRNGTVPTGFLAKFKDGFSSPPHIHNVTYRAFVIKGHIHNDDPNAEKMWMPAGSFWTQPAGESHITAAKGSENIAYVEIDQGPYLVKPIEEAFDNGERPVNLDKSNIVWLDASKSTFIDKNGIQNHLNAAKVAFLWKKNGLIGNLIKVPARFLGKIKSNASVFHAVVIQGKIKYQLPNEKEYKILDPGCYFSSHGKSAHQISSDAKSESVIYVRTNNNFSIIEIASNE